MSGIKEMLCPYPWMLKKIMNTLLSGNSKEGSYSTWITSRQGKASRRHWMSTALQFLFHHGKTKKKAFLKGLLT